MARDRERGVGAQRLSNCYARLLSAIFFALLVKCSQQQQQEQQPQQPQQEQIQ